MSSMLMRPLSEIVFDTVAFYIISSHCSSVTACGKHLGASGDFKVEYYGKEFYRSRVDVCVERMRQSMVFDYGFERYKTCMCSDAGND
jgi:hypothetical protein